MCYSAFDNKHTLRTAKATKGSVRRKICTTAISSCLDIWNKVRIRTMKKCAFHNCRRKISSCTRILIKSCFISKDLKIFIKTNLIIRRIRMSFSRHPHVLHSMQRIFYRSFQMICCQCTKRCPCICLVFFSPESAA